jgi:RimJ/RimL family protein N-acetyltransferase
MFGPVAEIIETRRLVLAPLAAADAEEMVHVLGDEALHDFIGGAPLPLSELRERYEKLVGGPAPYHQEGWLNWTVRRRGGPAVGYVQATVLPGPRASLAWVVGVPWQGRGYATEAALGMAGWLTARGVGELRAAIHPDNHASAAVARRLGLSPTAEHDDGEIVWSNAPDPAKRRR